MNTYEETMRIAEAGCQEIQDLWRAWATETEDNQILYKIAVAMAMDHPDPWQVTVVFADSPVFLSTGQVMGSIGRLLQQAKPMWAHNLAAARAVRDVL